MAKLTIDGLYKIKAETAKSTSLRERQAAAKITVHMGTCGIAAGAREVMTSLLEELAQSERSDIQVVTAGCLGQCSSEPNVTVDVKGAEPIVYQKMDANRIRQVFQHHVLQSQVQNEFVLR